MNPNQKGANLVKSVQILNLKSNKVNPMPCNVNNLSNLSG